MAGYNKSDRQKNARKSMKYVPVAVLLFIVALIIGLSTLFRVSVIEVTGIEDFTKDEIVSASGVEMGDNLVFFNESGVASRICSQYPYISSVSVSVKLPATVTIDVKESKAMAVIPCDGAYWIVDTDGRVLETTDYDGIGTAIELSGVEITEPVIGEKIVVDNNTKLVYLTELLNAIQASDVQDKITKMDITSIANISFDYDGKFNIKFGSGENCGKKLETLLQVIDRLKPEDRGTIQLTGEGEAHYIPA